ncbi:hypothetical protein AWC29_22860 [Mycobacterium triplex]|nr:hypothetical protein [Mycobacterium triplex]ORX01493.1 hypothetical protein AWC29_22860 [Mycobacterium triplex]
MAVAGRVRQCRGAEKEIRRSSLVCLRRARSSDGPALLRMHERCSLATRYARWLAPSPIFPAAYLRSVLAGGPEYVAIVAACSGRPSRVVGLASAALTSEGDRELGFLIEDHYQGLGIGTAMLVALMDLIGPDQGLVVSAHFENHWLLDKLLQFGTVVTHTDHGVIDARVFRGPRGRSTGDGGEI